MGQKLTNWFATQWPDAWAVARETHRAPRRADHPHAPVPRRAVLVDLARGGDRRRLQPDVDHPDAPPVSGPTDGRFHAFEGCDDNGGLLPDGLHPRVELRAGPRVPVPPARAHVRADRLSVQHAARRRAEVPDACCRWRRASLWNYVAAADGQMGTLMKLYREWLVSGDDAFLRRPLAAGEEDARLRLAAVGRRPGRRDGRGAAQHLRHRVLRPEHDDAARSTWARCAPPRRWRATWATPTPTSTRECSPRAARATTASCGTASTTSSRCGCRSRTR